MQTTNIYIARHGETEYNRTRRMQGRGINKSLNDTGRKQAKAIGRALGNKEINHIFSSSLKRSLETAEIIAEQLQINFESYKELDEMDFGIIEGQQINEVRDNLEQLNHTWKSGNTAFAIEQGESPDGVLERVLLRTDALLEKHCGQHILFVLHGRLIRILLAHWLEYGLSQMHRIKHQNGSLYHLQLREEQKMEVIYLNKTEHLEEVR